MRKKATSQKRYDKLLEPYSKCYDDVFKDKTCKGDGDC